MSDRSVAISGPSSAPPKAAPPPAAAARTKMLLEAPILPTLLRLAAPNILNLLAFAGVITFDGFFLGRIGTNALAGASLAFPWVMMMLQTTNSGMGVGVSSAVARALGAGRRDRADALVFHAFLLALAVAAIFSTVFLLGAPFLFRWMGGQRDLLSHLGFSATGAERPSLDFQPVTKARTALFLWKPDIRSARRGYPRQSGFG